MTTAQNKQGGSLGIYDTLNFLRVSGSHVQRLYLKQMDCQMDFDCTIPFLRQ